MKRSLLLSALLSSIATAAFGADIATKARPPAPVMVEVQNWTGFYLGLNGGYSWGRSRTTVNYFNSITGAAIVPPAGSVTGADFDLHGGIFGGQIGYNIQASNWVFGLEADIQWSGEKGGATFLCSVAGPFGVPGPCIPGLTFVPPGVGGTTLSLDQKIEWFGTVRGRAGMLFTPSVLAYVTGGLAYGSVKTGGALSSFTPAGVAVATLFSSSDTNFGWTVGAGLEAKFTSNWSGKLEYLYMDLGDFNGSVTVPAAFVGANWNSRVTDHIIRAGINYHFSAGPGPVMARY